MSGFERRQHRYAIALSAAVAVVLAILLIVLGTAGSADGRGSPPPTGDGTGGVDFGLVGNFEAPVNVAFAPGQSDNLYVVEQGGVVKVKEGAGSPETFLDLTDQTNGFGEQGLLGLAFHPAYQANHLVYAYYTDDDNGDIVVSEFVASDPTNADESTRRQVIRIRHRFASNHNGGQLLFGPDGHLYMATGDGGGAGDPRENAQSKRSLLGKLLRINPLDPPGPRRYSIPSGNPFKGRKGKNQIFARGLRNPFRFSFDPVTRRIAIGDVGQDRFEEVDYESKKTLRNANFGWDRYEGRKRSRSGDTARTPRRKRHDRPIHAYNHGADGGSCSITGGVVVRDPTLTNLYGRYLYADFCAGQLRSFIPRLRGARDVRKLDGTLPTPTSFTASPFDGRIYVTSLGGKVVRLGPQG